MRWPRFLVRGSEIVTLPARAAATAIECYQIVLSPWLPRACRFAPSCSEYARLAIVEGGFWRGLWLAAGRLLRCHPFHPGGYDPPPIGSRRG